MLHKTGIDFRKQRGEEIKLWRFHFEGMKKNRRNEARSDRETRRDDIKVRMKNAGISAAVLEKSDVFWRQPFFRSRKTLTPDEWDELLPDLLAALQKSKKALQDRNAQEYFETRLGICKAMLLQQYSSEQMPHSAYIALAPEFAALLDTPLNSIPAEEDWSAAFQQLPQITDEWREQFASQAEGTLLPASFCQPGSVAPLLRAALTFQHQPGLSEPQWKQAGLPYRRLQKYWSPFSPHLAETSRFSNSIEFDTTTTALLSAALRRSELVPEDTSEESMRLCGRRWTFARAGGSISAQELFEFDQVVSDQSSECERC